MKNKMNDKQIVDILIAEGYISEKDFDLEKESNRFEKDKIYDYLISRGLLTKDLFGQAMAEFLKVDYIDLNSRPVQKDQVLRIPEEFGRTHRLIFFSENSEEIVLVTDIIPDQNVIDDIKNVLGVTKNIRVAYSVSDDINDSLKLYNKSLVTRFEEIVKSNKKVAPEIIEEIVDEAFSLEVSDIHFEPRDDKAVVRFRIDGVLQEVGAISREYYEKILNRVKIQANLRIDEHFSSQDGVIRLVKDGTPVDLRVSVVPTVSGEKIAIRLLAQYVKDLALSDLGLYEKDRALLYRAIRSPFGMILSVGPTGSGKTTTLYSIIKMLNSSNINITTIEDPVEYKISGVNQIQVNNRTNLSFSQGLRSIVRQDPDVVLVGEIRDSETAEISVNAALTGHLLLSTLHSNDSSSAIPRLLDMGIEPFLLSSTLEMVVSQRLVRKLCENCRYSYKEKVSEIERKFLGAGGYFSGDEAVLYKSKGCPACGGLGYKGRVGVFEILEVNSAMKDLILKNPSADQIWKLAKKSGTKSLFDDGIDKVKNGITSLEEISRVISIK